LDQAVLSITLDTAFYVSGLVLRNGALSPFRGACAGNTFVGLLLNILSFSFLILVIPPLFSGVGEREKPIQVSQTNKKMYS
jgi:hypothetical protein